MKEYAEIYSGFVHPDSRTNWSSDEEVRAKLLSVNFDEENSISHGGVPLISDGHSAFVDTSDAHWMIDGNSGSKKSVCVFMPLIGTLIKSGENFIATDPKGELYRRTARYAKKQGYKVYVINFRDYNGEGYNPLSYPAKLYKSGEEDKAAAVSADLVSALGQRQAENSNIDSFWPDTAKAFNNGILPFMYSSYPNTDDINFLSLSDYYTNRTAEDLTEYLGSEIKITNAATQNLRTVLSEPEKTLMSTLSTCSSFIQPFIQNDKLARMLSHSTFDLDTLIEEKTALYIITDDASTVCDPIVGILISQIQSILVDKAYHTKDGRLKTRVNFVLDEFCSFPVPNIASALAAHRSRNIRYYLCVQSIDLLEKRYPNYKNMLTNCAVTLFLGTGETELTDMISKRCGTTQITLSGQEEPLISTAELMSLRQDWYAKEAIYLNLASGIRYCTTLPSIEKYKEFCRCGEAVIPNITHPPVHFYSLIDLIRDISDGKASKPFYPDNSLKAKAPGTRKKAQRKKQPPFDTLDANIRKKLEAEFDALFDALEDEEDDQ